MEGILISLSIFCILLSSPLFPIPYISPDDNASIFSVDTAYKEQEMLNNIQVDGLSIDSDEEPSRRNSNDNNNNNVTENNTNSNNNDNNNNNNNNNNLPKRGSSPHEIKMSSQSTGEVGRVFRDKSDASTNTNNNNNDNPPPNTSPTGRRKPKLEKKHSL